MCQNNFFLALGFKFYFGKEIQRKWGNYNRLDVFYGSYIR